MVKKFNSDVDIDVADRNLVLEKIKHRSAKIGNGNEAKRHASGIYVTPIPYDVKLGCSSIDFKAAEYRGYFKLDLLNVFVYRWVKDEQHLIELVNRSPDWDMLNDKNTVEKLIHLNNHFYTLRSMPEPVNSIPRLAMFLALIRPAKRYLIGRSWKDIAESIWIKEGTEYTFKKSHSLAYAHLIVVHMNLLKENPDAYNSWQEGELFKF